MLLLYTGAREQNILKVRVRKKSKHTTKSMKLENPNRSLP